MGLTPSVRKNGTEERGRAITTVVSITMRSRIMLIVVIIIIVVKKYVVQVFSVALELFSLADGDELQ